MRNPLSFRRDGEALVPIDSLRPEIADLILAEHPGSSPKGSVRLAVVRACHERYIAAQLRDDLGKLSELDAEVAHAVAHGKPLASPVDDTYEETRSFGDRAADALAAFGGSWAFIFTFSVIIAAWMITSNLMGKASFDPYPYILLNLVLSTLAAIQAPIIMMSQNRQEDKDRLRSRNDYQVNLKAELEIRLLHDRIEWLIARFSHDLQSAEAALATPAPTPTETEK